MINHYYTLIKLVEEFQFLKGFVILECFTQEKNILILTLYNGKSLEYLQFSAQPTKTTLFLRTNFSKSKKNVANQFPELIGKKIKNIHIVENERLIDFEISNNSNTNSTDTPFSNLDEESLLLRFILFGASRSNIVILNKKNYVLNSFRKKSELIGKELLIPKTKFKVFSDYNSDYNKEQLIEDALLKSDLLLGRHYTKQFLSEEIPPAPLLQRGEKDSHSEQSEESRNCSPASNFEQKEKFCKDFQLIYQKAKEFKSKCLQNNIFFLVESAGKELLFSLIRLDEYPKILDSSNSISYLLERKYYSETREHNFQKDYKELFTKLEKHFLRLKKRIERLETEQESDKESDYKLWAELLLSAPNPKARAGKQIELFDYEGNKIKIPLDQKLNLIENSKKYFEKARSSREKKEYNKHILKDLKRMEIVTSKYIMEMKKIQDKKELRDFRNKLQSEFKELNAAKSGEEHSKFRIFELRDGFTLYVGKSAANNDELTFGFGKANDYWFHARGAAGSHAILRFDSKDAKAPKDILREAASIAAYYSQQRNAKYVQVCYTQKKYVYKPKGAAPGSVALKREEVIMVEPKLPQKELGN